MEQGQLKDPRIYFAAERTFLAWIRTGLALMGFGFVVARFGLFLRESAAASHVSEVKSYGFSIWAGTAMVLADRKSTRLNSSHQIISYAVFCLKKKEQGSYLACTQTMSS